MIMGATGLFAGGFYTTRTMAGMEIPKAIVGKLDVRCNSCQHYILGRDSQGSFDVLEGAASVVDTNVICYMDTGLLRVRCGRCKDGEVLNVHIDSESVLLYGVPLVSKPMGQLDVFNKWNLIAYLGEFVREDVEHIGLYGYHFNNSVRYEHTKYKPFASKLEEKRRKTRGMYDVVSGEYARSKGVWYAGFAFSMCEKCNKWSGREVIQRVGDVFSYPCTNCEHAEVDYTITEEVFACHEKKGLVRDISTFLRHGSGESEDRGVKTVTPDTYLYELRKKRKEKVEGSCLG